MLRQRFKIEFSKYGDLRFISHHDVMRLFQRALRRAGIELRMSQGFNPHPKMIFAMPLGVGVESDCETLLLDTSRWYKATEVRERLQAELPLGIKLLKAELAGPQESAVPREVTYVVTLRGSDRKDEIDRRIQSFLQSRKVEIDRVRLEKVTRLDVRPHVIALESSPEGLRMRIRITPKGTARPEEVLGAIGLDPLAARIRRAELSLTP